MPELPEVESVRRLMERVLGGRRIVQVEVPPDEIVLGGIPPSAFKSALEGQKVLGVGRKGKYWWLELETRPWVFGHLGMTGWIREIGGAETRLKEHGTAPILDAEGKPRFLKLLLTAEGGAQIAFTDGRRLARLWLGESPEADPRVSRLGPDAHRSLPLQPAFDQELLRRKAPIKAVLLDQSVLSGIGNWIADEVLYAARIAPARLASELAARELKDLRHAIRDILSLAVEVEADYRQFPETWLFHHRWGGKRGVDRIQGKAVVRETVAGRTTAWVPSRQR